MAPHCKNPDCVPSVNCHIGKEDYTKCENWVTDAGAAESKKSSRIKASKENVQWPGEALSILDLSELTARNPPAIIGIVGKADAGKTTYLAMLFTLLLKGGRLKGWVFAGSRTLKTWDGLYQRLQLKSNNVSFPDPTAVSYLKFLHLAFKDSHQKLHDILLSDASGETFSVWSTNKADANAENARWVYKNSAAFILFIDCEDLASRKNLAKTEILDIAQMLKSDIRDRPVIGVWSKSDKKLDINPTIQQSLEAELKEILPYFHEISISNFSIGDPDILVHENNITVLQWVLEQINSFHDTNIVLLETKQTSESFFNYRERK